MAPFENLDAVSYSHSIAHGTYSRIFSRLDIHERDRQTDTEPQTAHYGIDRAYAYSIVLQKWRLDNIYGPGPPASTYRPSLTEDKMRLIRKTTS